MQFKKLQINPVLYVVSQCVGILSSNGRACSATAEAMGSNPIEVPKFFRVYLQLLKVALITIIIIIIIIIIITRIFIQDNLSVLIKRTVIKRVL